MTQPKPLPKAVRIAKYIISSFKMIGIIENWFVVPMGAFGLLDFSDGIILKLRNGVKFLALDFMDAWTIKEVFADNDYQILFSNKPATIIDIGANIGAFSVFAAHKRPKAKVLSFEPGKKAFFQLKENILLNEMEKRILPSRMAVYKKRQTIRLYDSGRTGLGSIYRVRKEKKYSVVDTITLKDIFIKYKVKVCDYLKVDCEGAEYEILSGCPPNILKKVRRISLEFHEICFDQNHHDLIKKLIDNGFKVSHKYNSIENNIGYIYGKR